MVREDAIREERLMYGHGALTEDELNEKYPNRPHNHSKTLPFSDLFLTLFNPLAENRKKPANIIARSKLGPHGNFVKTPHEARRQIVERFISRWRKEVGNDIYPAIRLMVPDKDRDRAMYGLKETTLGKLIVKVLKISDASDDAYSLVHWKLPPRGTSGPSGDFSARCFEVINKRPMLTKPGDLTVAEVNEMLDRLSVAQKEEMQLPIIEEFYRRMNAEELMWLVRMILRQVKIGASEKTILELWHPDAENLFSVSSSLRRVCWELYDPQVRLEGDDRGIHLMSVLQPQLAAFQMRTMEQMVSRMKLTEEDPVFWIEEKLDGERMQLHMVADEQHPGGKKFGFWSRKAKDYTYLYGDGFEDDDSALTRHLRNAFHENVRNIILDGEMMSWDPATNAYVPFGHLKTAANTERWNPYNEGIRPVFMVFDCLYLNDADLTRYTLRDRRLALSSSVKDVDHRLEIHKYVEAQQAAEVEPLLRQVVAESSEGLVLKNPRSAYKLNERNDDWVKVKPEYMTEFGEDLDCVVIGGYYGTGRRGGMLSSFMCGLKVPQEAIDRGVNPQKCYSFFKVGGGIGSTHYAAIRHKTDGKWIKWDSRKPPTDWIILGGGDKQFEKPDEWIKPEDSLVFQVKAASVTTTEQFATQYTLRFPRFKAIHQDKTWREALSVTDFIQLKSRAETEKKEKEFKVDNARKSSRVLKKKRTLIIQGQDEEVKPLDNTQTNVLDGLSFLVLSDSQKPKKSKAELEQFVKANGGAVVLSDKDSSTIVLSDRKVVKAASIIKRGQRNVVKAKWLFDCVKQSALVPYEPTHMLFTIPADEHKLGMNVDEYNDSYERDVDIDELRDLMQSMQADKIAVPEVDLGMSPGAFFSGLRAHFDNDATRLYFEFASGTVAALDDPELTHIVVDSTSSNLKDLKKAAMQRQRMPRLVSSRWVNDCWQEKTRLDEERYEPRL